MAIDTTLYTATKHMGVKIHKNKIDFLLNTTIDGKRYRRVFKSNPVHMSRDRLKTACAAREALHEEILKCNSCTADIDASMDDYWSKVKKLSRWQDRTLCTYDYFYMKHLSPSMGKLKVRNIKAVHLTDLNASMSHLANSTQSKSYEILHKIFNLAIEDEVIEKSPVKKSHVIRRNSSEEKKVIMDAETKYRLVYEAINTIYGTDQKITRNDKTIICENNPHHRAIFLFGFHGRRLQETLHLEWTDISFESMTYTIRGEHSKVNTDMVFKLPADVAEALMLFRASKGEVFNVSRLDRHYKWIRMYTGIPEFSFHWMRNLTVSALAAMGASVTHLSAMLGHNDGNTIRKYLSLQRAASTGHMEDLSKKLLGK